MDSGYIVCATPPIVYSISFETLQMSLPCFEDVHVVWKDPQITFYYHCFRNLNFGHSDNQSEWAVGTLCAQLILQSCSHSIETLQMY